MSNHYFSSPALPFLPQPPYSLLKVCAAVPTYGAVSGGNQATYMQVVRPGHLWTRKEIFTTNYSHGKDPKAAFTKWRHFSICYVGNKDLGRFANNEQREGREQPCDVPSSWMLYATWENSLCFSHKIHITRLFGMDMQVHNGRPCHREVTE